MARSIPRVRRIGLHTGEARTDADKFLGRTAILAARIGGTADAGQQLVSGLVRQLLADVGTIRFGNSRDVALAGIAELQAVVDMLRQCFLPSGVGKCRWEIVQATTTWWVDAVDDGGLLYRARRRVPLRVWGRGASRSRMPRPSAPNTCWPGCILHPSARQEVRRGNANWHVDIADLHAVKVCLFVTDIDDDADLIRC